MSQLPRPGQKSSQGGNTVRTTTSKTSGIPGTGRNITVTQTRVTELIPCQNASSRSSSVGVGTGPRGQSGLRPPSASGLRPPGGGGIPQRSGLRAPCSQSSTQTAAGQRGTCGAARAGGAAPPSRLQPPSRIQPPSRMPQPGSRAPPCSMQPPAGRPSGLQPPRTSATRLQQPGGGVCPAAGGAQRSIPRPGGVPATSSVRSIGRPSGLQAPRASGIRPPCPGAPPASSSVTVEPQVKQQLMQKSLRKPDQRVIAKAMTVKMPVVPEVIDTPEGPQPIIQQTVLEQRVERDERGERVIKNLGITDVDPCTGVSKTIAMGIQQLDPKFPKERGREVISATSKVSITASFATVQQTTSRAITEPLSEAADLTAADIAKLVDEEKEDVDNTLKIFPPDLVMQPGRYEMKKRQQQLRLNSESVALLEQSIIHPEPTADEAQAEPSPETLAAMMHTVEKGVPPQSTPDQVFNSLFSEASNEKYIKLSSVVQGPLQDVVVPTEMPKEVHQEVVTGQMEKLTERLQGIPDSEEIPYVDIFTQVMGDDKKSPTKGKNKEIEFPVLADEKSLWVNADLQHLVNVVGAEPVEVIDSFDVSQLEADGSLEEQLAKGLQYYVDADPIQYMSRVQLRGTQPPSYFPGYMVALPEFAEVVRLARSPDEVFASAWKAAQPKYFEEDSMQSLLF